MERIYRASFANLLFVSCVNYLVFDIEALLSRIHWLNLLFHFDSVNTFHFLFHLLAFDYLNSRTLGCIYLAILYYSLRCFENSIKNHFSLKDYWSKSYCYSDKLKTSYEKALEHIIIRYYAKYFGIISFKIGEID